MNLFVESEDVIIFKSNEGELNLEEFLRKEGISGRLFRRLYKGKNIFVNGSFQRKDLKIGRGDLVSILIGEEEESTRAQDLPLDIIYEDFDLLIINKEPGVVVHPTKSHQENTLSNGIAYHFMKNNIKRKIRFVNRLDMDTTGLLIVAKSSFSHQQLALQFEENTVDKKYKALVEGRIQNQEAYIDLPIGREEEKSIRKTVLDSGQKASTKYKVLDRYKNASLLDVQIFTGRSHQIRVHLSHIGHPIIGDSLYNKESEYIKRQALHSYYLKINHPRSRESIEFIAPLPHDMNDLIRELGRK